MTAVRRSFLYSCVLILWGPRIQAQWQAIPSGTTDSLTAITWVEDRFMVAGGGLTFLRSFDNGQSFSATAGYAPSIQDGVLDILAFHDSLVGYGSNAQTCCAFQRTLDGGMTWEGWDQFSTPDEQRIRMRFPANGNDQVVFKQGAGTRFSTNGELLDEPALAMQVELDSVCPVPGEGACWIFINGEDTTYSTGSYGWTLTSNDRGGTVQTGTFPYTSYFYSAHVVRGDTIAYEAFGDLFTSHDKGVSWLRRNPFPHSYPWNRPAFRMCSSARGLAWGNDGRIHLTTDSAMSWLPVTDPLPYPLNDILFVDEDHVLAVGDQGTILASTDGGYTWEEEQSGTDVRLHALALSDNAVIVIGNEGVILRRFPAISGFSTNVAGSLKQRMALFPNPATSIINIRLETGSAAGTPAFSVRDALGRGHGIQAVPGGNGMWVLDIAQLPNGVHTLESAQGGAVVRRTFMVVR